MSDKATLRHPEKAHRPDNPVAMRKPREAVQFNQFSVQLFGNHPVTYGNMGICYYHAEQPEEALRCFDKSLELSPNYGLPKAWKARVIAETNR